MHGFICELSQEFVFTDDESLQAALIANESAAIIGGCKIKRQMNFDENSCEKKYCYCTATFEIFFRK